MLVEAVFSNEVERQYDATMKFRKMLSKEQNPPIEQVIHAGVVPKFVQFLTSQHGLLQVTLKARACAFNDSRHFLLFFVFA